jgi:hypothetical protein
MRRRAARIDANQPEIVEALKGVGASVQSLAPLGGGVADLLVGFRMVNYLMEVKDGSKPPSRRRLTDDQIQWHDDWRAPVHIVETVADALRVIGMEHHA